MNKKPIFPNLQQPVDRLPTGQLPSALVELNEAVLSGNALAEINEAALLGDIGPAGTCILACSYDGGEEE